MGKNNDMPLAPEDYVESRCLLCGEEYGAAEIRPIPQRRITEKTDEYMSRRDYAGVERHLTYWLEEARLGRDLRGEFYICGELVGHFRKTGEREKMIIAAARELELIGVLGFEGTVSAGTAYVNVATAWGAFGENEKSYDLFCKAKAAYESANCSDPDLLGGLYNNMALTCVSLSKFDEADELFAKALEIMEKAPSGELECAMTLLNMADAATARYGAEEAESRVYDLLDRSRGYFDGDHPRDGYYAFVCEKCAPTFEYYGYFADAKELARRAEEIYERA